ncbi:hypothetical protein QPK87_38145 [Kamptonema cortianum]|nr:hypothetical protein [Kamptonema cortianum]
MILRHHHPRQISGITLAEVVISMSILMIASISIISGFIFMQRSAMDSAYYTGAQRILQMHSEGVLGMASKDIVTTNFVAYNYSGLRVTSISDESVQEGLTNNSLKTFQAFTRSGTNIVSTNITVMEDAVLAYSIFYNVTTNMVSGTYTGVTNSSSFNKAYRTAEISVMWYNTRGMSNRVSAVVMKSEAD